MAQRPVRVTIFGACGRMGRELVRAASDVNRIQVVAAVDRQDHPCMGEDSGVLAGIGRNHVVVTSDLEAALEKTDVVVDFSNHAATAELAKRTAEKGRGLVCGTTGIGPVAMDALKAASKLVPVVASPNMSLGMNVLFRIVADVAKALGEDYDVEIVEWHHRHKEDAPSGTALRLASAAAEALGRNLDETGRFGRHGHVGPRRREEIGVFAVRAGDVVGDHTVLFGGEGERLELVHRVTTRRAFALGALRAALWVFGRRPGLYDMQDVLGLKERRQ